jgi:hypothetical protein
MLYNINPNIWGGNLWRFMHYLTIAYPENPSNADKENVKKFFASIGNILPCEKCRAHFALNIKNYPLTDSILENRYNLINWLKDIHNEVNIRNNKKTWTYQDIINEYENETVSYKTEIATVILLITIIIIIIFYMMYRKNIT